MNINSQELLLINKNMKFGETKPTEQPTTTVESPITKPDAGMKALEIQANNNINFQGGVTSQVLKSFKSKMAPLAFAAMLGLGAQSCINMEQEMDASAITAMLSQIADKLDKVLDGLDGLKEEVKNGFNNVSNTLSRLESQQKIDSEQNKEFQDKLLKKVEVAVNTLKANGATQEQILATTNSIYGQAQTILSGVETSNESWQEALDKLDEIKVNTDSIDTTLKDLLSEVKGMREDMNNGFAKVDSTLLVHTDLYNELLDESKTQTEKLGVLDEINNNTKAILANTDSIKASNNAFREEVNNNFDGLMTKLDEMHQDDKEFQAWEKHFQTRYGLELKGLLLDWKKDDKKAQKATLNAIDSLGKKLDKLSNIVNNQLSRVNAKFSVVLRFLPELLKQNAGIKNEIRDLTNAVEENTSAINKNTTVTEEGLNEISTQLDDINDKLDEISKDITTANAKLTNINGHLEKEQEYHEKMVSQFGDAIGLLEKIQANQKEQAEIAKETIGAIKGGFVGVREDIQNIRAHVTLMGNDVAGIKEAINNLGTDGEGMTVQEFIDASLKLDSINAQNTATLTAQELEKLIKKYGFDKLPNTTTSIALSNLKLVELVENIDNRLANEKDYTVVLNNISNTNKKILTFLEKADLSHPDYANQFAAIIKLGTDIKDMLGKLDPTSPDYTAQLEKLQKTVEELELKCDCDHTTPPSSDEGVDDSTDLDKDFS